MKVKARAQQRASLFLVPLSALVVLTALLLGGCNTISGAGKDVSAIGQGVDTTAQTAEEKMFGEDEGGSTRRGGY